MYVHLLRPSYVFEPCRHAWILCRANSQPLKPMYAPANTLKARRTVVTLKSFLLSTIASYLRGCGARSLTAGARDNRYSCRSWYSFALTVYRSAFRKTGSIGRLLLLDDDDDWPSLGGGDGAIAEIVLYRMSFQSTLLASITMSCIIAKQKGWSFACEISSLSVGDNFEPRHGRWSRVYLTPQKISFLDTYGDEGVRPHLIHPLMELL